MADADVISIASSSDAAHKSSPVGHSLASGIALNESVPSLAKGRQHDLRDASFTRRTVYNMVESDAFNYFILLVIVLNGFVLGLQTSLGFVKQFGWFFTLIDNVFLGVYLWELMLKLYALKTAYFISYWNTFDVIIIVLSLVAWLVQGLVEVSTEVSNIFSIIRVFRTVRIIRFLYELKRVRFLRSLQIITATLFKSMSTIASIALLAAVFLYVCAVAAVILYGTVDSKKFGSLGKSLVRLFQVITLDRWSEMYTDNKDSASGIWALGFILIIIETFVFENLFVAVIVNNLQSSRDLIELKKQKRQNKQKKREEDDFGSKNSLGHASKQSDTELDNIFGEQHNIDNYYPPFLSIRLKELISNYYMNLVALDHSMSSYQKQQKLLDDLLVMAKKHQDKDFE